jgi:hypothetical protein
MHPRVLLAVVLAVLPLALLAAVTESSAGDAKGFLFGTVVTESGTEYRGFLRWGTQEAFWDDLFHSRKDELPYVELARELAGPDAQPEPRRNRVRMFKFQIEWEGGDWQTSRIFIARFGDIDRIEVTGSDAARVHLRNGEIHDVSGYSDDVGATIRVLDEKAGEIELKWNRIDNIQFEPVPRGADPGTARLYGRLHTRSGHYEGYITWDKEEAMTSDLLDGDGEDGRMSIPMGEITMIERRGRRASTVHTQDGRRLRLRGTNDVNSDNRGIMVEDEHFGKITIEWDEFDRLELRTAPGSGRGYADYPKAVDLRGSVRLVDGRSATGRIVFDLDEASTWEMLNGRMRDVEFDVPFSMVTSIRPDGPDAAIVELRNGERLELEDSQDVSERNAGLLVFEREDADPVYVKWSDIERIEFDR